MKPRNWRQYYGYRPQSLAELGRLSPEAIKRQEKAYIRWLAQSRGLTLKDAETHARSQRFGGLLSSTADLKSGARDEEWISGDCVVRSMRCFSASAKEHWNPETQQWQRFGGRSGNLPKSDAPTTYAVIIGGRYANSFLSKATARRWAKERAA